MPPKAGSFVSAADMYVNALHSFFVRSSVQTPYSSRSISHGTASHEPYSAIMPTAGPYACFDSRSSVYGPKHSGTNCSS